MGDEQLQKGSDGVLDVLLSQGVLGVMVILLLIAVWHLWKKLQESQEKRIEMAMQVTKVCDAATSALERNTDAFDRAEDRP